MEAIAQCGEGFTRAGAFSDRWSGATKSSAPRIDISDVQTPSSIDVSSCASTVAAAGSSDGGSSDSDVPTAKVHHGTFEESLDMFADSEDEEELLPTGSPSKSARRRMRRRRQRDVIRAAAAAAQADGTARHGEGAAEPQERVRERQRPSCALAILSPSATPTSRAIITTPQFLPGGMRSPLSTCSGATPSACSASTFGSSGVMSTSPCAGSVVRGDASERAPVNRTVPQRPMAVCAVSPPATSPHPPLCCSYPMLEPPRAVCIVAAPVSVVPVARPALAHAAVPEAFRKMFGDAPMTMTRDELLARLEAAAPEVYED
eukprot:TRINITY_DN4405_c0_g1_i1.p1 TRINITY_DN4405_c0_g1~~TRINITY_DN4405_c0_g1_i1.p1  ORF type:complete len:318 (-),score=54.82 TRINITY_DN4405_c0_g1_i1:445-1398(-)